MFERGGEWRVVDFKTGHLDRAGALREYGAQMAGYAGSLGGLLGLNVKVAPAICLVRRGEVVESP